MLAGKVSVWSDPIQVKIRALLSSQVTVLEIEPCNIVKAVAFFRGKSQFCAYTFVLLRTSGPENIGKATIGAIESMYIIILLIGNNKFDTATFNLMICIHH